jgi:sugar O-acyltransferase (sialic acid O-acetyltransferase NeuD family)
MSLIENKILLYGASGHAKVICSILESINIHVEGIFDDNKKQSFLNRYSIIGPYDKKYKSNLPILISIGDNLIRKKISQKLSHHFSSAIHISSIIDDMSKIGKGTTICQSTIIQRDVHVGMHCIVNTNASVDHDCIISDFVHISPSVTLCGNVYIGEGTHIGAGATIIPNIKIGKWCVIGAGAVITKDIPDYSLVVGVPGVVIKNLKND